MWTKREYCIKVKIIWSCLTLDFYSVLQAWAFLISLYVCSWNDPSTPMASSDISVLIFLRTPSPASSFLLSTRSTSHGHLTWCLRSCVSIPECIIFPQTCFTLCFWTLVNNLTNHLAVPGAMVSSSLIYILLDPTSHSPPCSAYSATWRSALAHFSLASLQLLLCMLPWSLFQD